MLRALAEVKRRSKNAAGLRVASTNVDQFVCALMEANFRPSRETRSSENRADRTVKARQVIGQPAGEGVAVGRARVVKRPEDLLVLRTKDYE